MKHKLLPETVSQQFIKIPFALRAFVFALLNPLLGALGWEELAAGYKPEFSYLDWQRIEDISESDISFLWVYRFWFGPWYEERMQIGSGIHRTVRNFKLPYDS